CLRLEYVSMTRFHSDNAVVAFAGLDPRSHQSGDTETQHGISHRGRSAIRAQLYMAALTAIQHNPVIRAFYLHLCAQGKEHLTAVTACMAKMLRLAYACMITDQPFDADQAAATRQRYL